MRERRKGSFAERMRSERTRSVYIDIFRDAAPTKPSAEIEKAADELIEALILIWKKHDA